MVSGEAPASGDGPVSGEHPQPVEPAHPTSGRRPPAPLPALTRIQRVRIRAVDAAERYEQARRARPILGLPLRFYAAYTDRQGILLASAIAFRLYLWLMPFALLAAGVLAAIANAETASYERAAKDAGIAGLASQQVVTALRAGNKSWWIAVVIGLVGLAWASRTMAKTILVVSARLWNVRQPDQIGRRALRYGGVVLGGMVVVIAVALVVSWLEGMLPGGVVLGTVIEAAALGLLWWAVMLRLPDARRSDLDLLPGAIVVGTCFAVLHAISRVYLPAKIEHSSDLYGALGIAAVFLAWLLILGQVVVGSLLVNVVWSEHRWRQAAPPP